MMTLVGGLEEQEFVPLPYFPWDERPASLPLDIDEACTAIHLAHGDLVGAADLLKVPVIRLKRLVRAAPRLQRILTESLELVADQAASKAIRILYDPGATDRRVEWAVSKILQSRVAQGHPLSPAPALTSQSSAALVGSREVTFRWRTEGDGFTSGD
jgi:hypothetical protein